jgi:hypothetical protein
VSKGGASAPPAVDPTALANAQTGSNIATANQQSVLNNVNTFSPFGSSTYSQSPSGQWNLNQQLNPGLQNLFGTQASLAQVLANQAGSAGTLAASPAQGAASLIDNSFGTLGSQLPTGPANYSGLAQLPTSATDFSNEVGQAQNAAYNTQTGYLDPQFQQKQSDLTQQLADQGISAGSSAYDRAQGDLGRQETLAYQQAQDAAVQAGNQQQQALFGENLQSRQQGVNEANTQWAQPLNALTQEAQTGEGILSGIAGQLPELGSLAGFAGTGTVPTMGGSPTSVYPSNVVGAQGVANTADANRFNAGTTLNAGLGGLAGALGNSNLLFGSQGLSGALGIPSSTGLFGSLFGGGGSVGAGLAGGATADAGLPLGLAALGIPVGV